MMFGRKKRRIERLLVVEDEPLVAFDTEHFLTGEGFAVAATVDTVAEALRVIAADAGLDLVLADVSLADGSGVEVARAAQGRGLPVLFVTGSFPEEARALAAGCLAKPYPQRDLLAAITAIEAVLEGTRAPRRLPGSFSLFLSAA
ncbi:MAG: response regulator [Sphingomonas sp.]|uniref:response regulator n=1 Tax=unclassified Sphingomonas TaxID=196159 RepID=UPI002457E5BC|nr:MULTISPECIES: response regulator [unclassified Sphingomonas]MBQ1499250.1 response regulator [Sphingomonas sp.]MDH4746669.1 response regulator [Sphingomonas sp. CBMAI 2297]